MSKSPAAGNVQATDNEDQPQLPSTVPDSQTAPMAAATGSQSQGDTQPLSDSTREKYASGIWGSEEDGLPQWQTLHTGDPGHINLLEGFEQPTIQ